MDRVQEETLAVSATDVIVDRKYNRALLLQMRSHRLTEENPRKVLVPEEKARLEEKAERRAKNSSNESVRTHRVIVGTLPYVKILDAYMAINAISDILRKRKSQARSQSNMVRKDQLLHRRTLYNWVV